jgi:hypothetical protein
MALGIQLAFEAVGHVETFAITGKGCRDRRIAAATA